METIAAAREFIENPRFERDRETILAGLDLQSVDSPIREHIAAMSALPYCFTIQSCYGHFVHSTQAAPDNLEPVPTGVSGPIRYRIAYMAICLENSKPGRLFRQALEQITVIDPAYIEFASPEWFWEQYSNSFVLQVEPSRFMNKDAVTVGHLEALHIQRIRDCFFSALAELLQVQNRGIS